VAFFVAQPPPAAAAAPATPGAAAAAPALGPPEVKNPIEITAANFTLFGKKNQAVWTGDVRAVRGPTELRCQRLVAYYGGARGAQEITRLECIGSVQVTDGDKLARGERAEFDTTSGVLVMTGSPEARQGDTYMRGTKVTFTVGTDVMSVENAKLIVPTSGQGRPQLPAKGSGTRKGSGKPP
jgi:lipopolysaccharide export system protein LptA